MTDRRRHAVWRLLPALFWIAVQTAMAGGMAVSATAGESRFDAGAIWICTAGGPKEILAKGPGPAGPAGHQHHDCDWCQAFGAGPGLTAPPAITSPRRLRAAPAPFPSLEPFASAPPALGFWSRGPPA